MYAYIRVHLSVCTCSQALCPPLFLSTVALVANAVAFGLYTFNIISQKSLYFDFYCLTFLHVYGYRYNIENTHTHF